MLKQSLQSLTTFERILWICSVIGVAITFFLGDTHNLLTLIASLIGVTALIFLAKGNLLGQMLTVVFSLLYALISWQQQYYGEMITYLGMTAPIALLSVISWLRHPYQEGVAEVKVSALTHRRFAEILVVTAVVTFGFYFILDFFDTPYLLLSTLSIATSFLASALMFFRCAFYAIAYAGNDVVLISLWVLASMQNTAYLPMVLCFSIFLFNDLYAFYNWRRISKRQNKTTPS